MSLQKITHSALWQLLSQFTTMTLGILGVKFVTTAMSQSLVGNHQTVYSFLQIFGILADAGLYAIAVREYSRSVNRAVTLWCIFVLRLLLICLSLGAAIIFAWVIPSFRGTPLPLGITIASFVPAFTLLAGVLRTVFQVEYKMRAVYIAEVVGKAIPIAVLGLAVLSGIRNTSDVGTMYFFLCFAGVGAFAIFFISALFVRSLLPDRTTLSGARLLFQRGSAEHWSELRRIARLALPYGLVFLATTIYRQSDMTLIALLRPHDYDMQNAFYGVVMRMTEVGFLLPTFILNSALPVIVHEDESGRDVSRIFGGVFLGLLSLGSIVMLFAFLWAKPIILLLTREAYLSTTTTPGSDSALRLISLSIFFAMIVSYCFYLLLHRHRWRPLLSCTLGAAILSVSMNLFLIPQYGFMGAGITSLCVHGILSMVLLGITMSLVKVSLPPRGLLRWIGFSVTLAILLKLSLPFLFRPLITLFAGAAGVAISFVLLFLFGLARKEAFRGIDK